MVNAIRNYFLKYNFPKKALMNVDSLPSKSNNFSIDFTPCKPIVEQYINGTCLKQQTFVLAGRFAYSNDNSHILAFFEDLSNWINNNNNNHLPKQIYAKGILVILVFSIMLLHLYSIQPNTRLLLRLYSITFNQRVDLLLHLESMTPLIHYISIPLRL